DTTSAARLSDALDCLQLIIGEPGVGKTTLLVHWARDWLRHATNDATRPLPVVFNLASWAHKRLALDEWLIEELAEVYGIRRALARTWVMTDEILPLLDGFDAVDQANRAGCALAINRFRRAVVVCSRRAEYHAQPTRLHIQVTVHVEPFTPAQAATY